MGRSPRRSSNLRERDLGRSQESRGVATAVKATLRAASEGSRDVEPALEEIESRDLPREVLLAALVALVLALLGYALNGHGAMNLQDEGFLWYGVVHTLEGQVPLRDFRA